MDGKLGDGADVGTSWVLGDMLRIAMSSIMRWRSGEIGLVIGCSRRSRTAWTRNPDGHARLTAGNDSAARSTADRSQK